MASIILAGDIGGTKSILALFKADGPVLAPLFEKKYTSASFSSVSDLVNHFRGEAPDCSIKAACLGFAGPVMDGKSQAVNLGWQVDQEMLRRECSLSNLTLLNDLVALSCALPFLDGSQLSVLKDGRKGNGNIALLAAGTGLGEALLLRDRDRFIPCPSEGGHRDFSPRNEEECDLLRFLLERHGHVSTERVLSGYGIIELFLFFLRKTHSSPPPWLEQAIEEKDASPISSLALSNKDPLCCRAMTLFTALYGSEAGNLALQYLATGGVYLGGGIGAKIQPLLCSEVFRNGFTEKGRMRELLREIPVYLITDPGAGLLGAAHYAAGHL